MRILRLIGAVLGGLCVCLSLAAWQLPNVLDWNRYRAAIAAEASARLGRPVAINGTVRLQLLPHVVLTASRVTLADRGDGVSASIGALRLQVAFGPLLHGRIVPRDLVLDDPVLRLPWPLPPDIAAPASARVPKGFAAHIEGGTLQLGSVTLTGFSAGLRSDADTGAFAANGLVTGTGQSWRFTSLLGAPGADGISVLNLTVDGQGTAQDTGGFFRGRMLPSSAVDGVMSARGPDLSHVMPAPATPWRLGGHIGISGLQVQAPALDISIGGSPGEASMAISLEQPFGLRGKLNLGQVDLGAWAGAVASAPHAAFPVHLELAATAGALFGGTVRAPHGTLTIDSHAIRLEHASGTLPGSALLKLDGDLGQGFAGVFALNAPDLRATLRWLRPLAPEAIDALPPNALTHMSLAGDVRAGKAALALSGLSGTLDGSNMLGSLDLTYGPHPHAAASLTLDSIDIGRWRDTGLAQLRDATRTLDSDFRIDVKDAEWRGIKLTRIGMDAHTGPGGVSLTSLAFDAGGGHVTASGTMGADGQVQDAKLAATATDASRMLALLPLGARVFPGLWQGGFDLAVTAAGKPDAIATQLRADLGDVRLEADGTLDLPRTDLAATITVRHPGAPRLLKSLGVENAADWIDYGSVALAAHLHAQPGHVTVHDFGLSAASLRIGGSMEVDTDGDLPDIDATLHAEDLTLPMPPARGQLPFSWLGTWKGHMKLEADTVSFGLRPRATKLHASLRLDQSILYADQIQVTLANGLMAGEAALDASGDVPALVVRGTLRDTTLAPLGLPVDFASGQLNAQADMMAHGQSWPALLATAAGDVSGTVTAADITGVDLAGLTHVLSARGARLRPALQSQLGTGQSGDLHGDFSLSLNAGSAVIQTASLSDADGTIDVTGGFDLPDGTVDLLLAVRPTVPAPPALGVRLVGPIASARRVNDVAPGLLWAGKGHGSAGH